MDSSRHHQSQSRGPTNSSQSQMHLEHPYPEGEQLPPLFAVSGGSPRPGLQSDASPARRQTFPRISLPSTSRVRTRSRDSNSSRRKSGPSASPVADKSKRVRTGCLTCRERHLKCDEGLPDCNNCLKSKRECKRGLRLNFLDIQVKEPPRVAPTAEWLGPLLHPYAATLHDRWLELGAQDANSNRQLKFKMNPGRSPPSTRVVSSGTQRKASIWMRVR